LQTNLVGFEVSSEGSRLHLREWKLLRLISRSAASPLSAHIERPSDSKRIAVSTALSKMAFVKKHKPLTMIRFV
jgi:hypothetical protein